MRIPEIRSIIENFESYCNSTRKNLVEPLKERNFFRGQGFSVSTIVENASSAHLDFEVKSVPICSWLKYPEVARDKRIYVTDFSEFSDIIEESNLRIEWKMKLIMYIISTNIENGLLSEKTKQDQRNIFKRVLYKVRHKKNYRNEGEGFKNSIEWYKQRMEKIDGIIPSALYNRIYDFDSIIFAHQLFSEKIKELNDIYKISLEDLKNIFVPLNISQKLIDLIWQHITSHNKIAEQQNKPRSSSSKPTSDDRSYQLKATEELNRIAESDKEYKRFIHFLKTYKRQDGEDLISIQEIMEKYDHAVLLEIDKKLIENFLKLVFSSANKQERQNMLNYLYDDIIRNISSTISTDQRTIQPTSITEKKLFVLEQLNIKNDDISNEELFIILISESYKLAQTVMDNSIPAL